jgi:hypothetical protein
VQFVLARFYQNVGEIVPRARKLKIKPMDSQSASVVRSMGGTSTGIMGGGIAPSTAKLSNETYAGVTCEPVTLK